MKTVRLAPLAALAIGASVFSEASNVWADEGMWLFNTPPTAAVKERYGFELTAGWLDRAMKAGVRLSAVGSGAFVSPRALMVTNHHVVSACLQALSEKPGARDLMKEGFVARRREDEQRCPDLEANVLVRIEDVTAQIKAKTDALGAKASDADKNRERKAEMARLKKACADKSGRRCEIVTLYAGGAYHLYELESWTDVRVVFAPEAEVAFFGGDQENFTYPRHAFDVAFLRVYDKKGAPLSTPNHFVLEKTLPPEGTLTFVAGNPFITDRFVAVSRLEFLKKTTYPTLLEWSAAYRDRMILFGSRGEKELRSAREEVFDAQNNLKALNGYLAGLSDPKLMNAAAAREKKVIDGVKALKDAAAKNRLLEAWPKLSTAYKTYAKIYTKYWVIEGSWGPSGRLASIARHTLRIGEELPLASEVRLREYRDSALPSLEMALFSDAPIDDALEIEKIAFGLELMEKVEPAIAKRALAGKTPRARAEEVVRGTKLRDVAVRKSLAKGGRTAIAEANDPLIEMFRSFERDARLIRQTYEDEVEGVERQYAGRVAEAYGQVYGAKLYPDATFTPRLNFGVVKGYEEKGAKLPYATMLSGVFVKSDMADGAAPYALPKRWLDAKSKLDMSTPLNFVTTNDMMIGNSGSPTFDRNGRLLGVLFDSNLSQLPNRFFYREETERSIHVGSRAILHILDKIYGAGELIKELAP